jgi:membrane-bound lytic murein transglycosylase B
MRTAGPWWPRVSIAAVLAVLAVAMIAGLRPTPGVAIALRASAPASTSVPAASVTTPGALLAPVAAGRTIASRGDVAYALAGSALTIEDIPVRALSAYQRAATVIDRADGDCHLDWQLLASLGKVLTDHGRVDGAQLDEEGVPRPRVVGQRLTGRHGTQRIPDSDAGLLDGDPHVDRAVGPMMLLPAVWSVVNVDGDSDGRRNPQDVDDAALGAAVFLCSGEGDLRNPANRRSEIKRYHAGSDYTRSVLGVRTAYLDAEAVTTVSVLAREEGVAVAPAPGVPTSEPTDQVFSAGSQFDPALGATTPPQPTTAPSPTSAPSPTGAPGPSASPTPSGDPSPSGNPSPSGDPSPSGSPSPSGDPSPTGSPSPTVDPSGCASPSDAAGTTDGPTECPGPSGSPSPTPSAAATGGGARTTGLAVPFLPVLPMGAWLWRRRRRAADLGEAAAV